MAGASAGAAGGSSSVAGFVASFAGSALVRGSRMLRSLGVGPAAVCGSTGVASKGNVVFLGKVGVGLHEKG